ncbi:MAG TPA: saccharopine dehydrogenase NADP-binding domain-containing protein [Candidatus Kapabacteria bacterium]|nr:saccharopine dehydrogenase NADP-binding domain-containing protein [Candidatus Kapabacteria bacterium]
MRSHEFMIYGATGFTGRLIAEEAVRRGHRPLLAGRSERPLAELAGRLGLEHAAFDLGDHRRLVEAVSAGDLVLHVAGPFVFTAAPMVRACLEARTNYIDITGELPVLQATFACDDEALAAGIALVTACGFDVIPTDCLAALVAARLPEATSLEIAINTGTTPSPGTLLSTIESLPRGGWVRREGLLWPYALGRGARRQRFHDRERTVLPMPIGDLETAWRSTGIPNITTYFSAPRWLPPLIRILGPLLRPLVRMQRVGAFIRRIALRYAPGPEQELQQHGFASVWARVANQRGDSAEAWLQTAEPYRFTAMATVMAVEYVLATRPTGALAPSQALGADFVLKVPGSQLFERLEGKG